MIELQSVNTMYGAVPMLRDVSIAVAEGELVCLLGPNGAGKTTAFRAITGLLPLSGGHISIMNCPLASLRTEALAGLGIGFVPEARRLFPDLTVYENIRLGFAATGGRGQFDDGLAAMADRFPIIKQRLRQRAGTLSGGEQAMVALARAIVGEPKLLIMDEPSLGLSPKLIEEYFDIIRDINRRGTTIFLIEQNAETALSIAHRGYLLVKGRVAASGVARDLLDNEMTRHLYF
jgi:branched-chain amino acid transport system ATP-binding protein